MSSLDPLPGCCLLGAARPAICMQQQWVLQNPPPPGASCRSPAPRTRRGLLAAAQRLARQAANLEEEAKRQEAQAFYCVREAEQLDGVAGACCDRF